MRNVLLVVAALIAAILCRAEAAPPDEGNPRPSLSGEAERHEADDKDRGEIVAALVNGVEIKMEAVEVMMKSLGTGKGQGHTLVEDAGAVKKEALNQLILQELAYQKAKSEGLIVEEPEIDKAIADIRIKLGDEGKYREFLDKEGISENELRTRVQRNILLKRIFTREILDKVGAVPEDALKKEYEQDKEKYTKPEKIVVVDVVLFMNPDDADSQKKANEILSKINADNEKNPSNLPLDGAFAVRDLEVKEDQEKDIYNEAGKLKVGELSGVFSSSGTLHIIKLKEHSPLKQFTFEEVKSGLERKYRAEARKKRLLEWEAELKKNAKIEIMETGNRKQ